jgi:hypothetical protein
VDAARNKVRMVGRRIDAIQAPAHLNFVAGQSWEDPVPKGFAGRHISPVGVHKSGIDGTKVSADFVVINARGCCDLYLLG